MEETRIQKAAETKQAAVSPGNLLKKYVEAQKDQIARALPSVLTPERFTRMALTAISVNPALGRCTPQSFLGAMMQAAQLGLEPNTPLGQAYLIPYKTHGTEECQFQLGYKGLLDLAYRSGEIKSIQAHEVFENDVFEYRYGLEPQLKHVPAKKERGSVTHVYAVFETKNGGYGFEVMSVEDVEVHAARYSKAYSGGSSPWKTNFSEMAKKTVLKKVLKYAPIHSDFVRGLSADETIKTELMPDMVSEPDVTVYVDESTGEAEVMEE